MLAILFRVDGEKVERVRELEVPSPGPYQINMVREPERFNIREYMPGDPPDLAPFEYETYTLYRKDDYFGNWAEYVYRVPQSKRRRHE